LYSSGGERDAVELIRQQLGVEQFGSQCVRLWIAADVGDELLDAFAEQLLLNEFLGVRVNRDVLAVLLESCDPPDEIGNVIDLSLLERADDATDAGFHVVGDSEFQCQFRPVLQKD